MSKKIITHNNGIIETRETFYTEKTIQQLKQQLEEKDKEIERLKVFEKAYYFNQTQVSQESMDLLLQNAYQVHNETQLAIQELEKVKVNLKDRISMMKNKEHSYLQKVVAWYAICDQINQQIKELKGEK